MRRHDFTMSQVVDLTRAVDGRFQQGTCYSPATQFKRGRHAAPATEIKAGQRLSPATEFAAGQEPHNRLPVGSITIRRETHTGLDRAWIKTAEPNVWRKRAVVVWEAAHGPVARGAVVHHHDRNSLNDELENLRALTRKEHADEHRQELLLARGIETPMARALIQANFMLEREVGRMAA